MLAMSMSDDQPPSGSGTGSREEAERHGWAIDFAPSAEPETSDEEADLPPNVQFRPDEPVEAVTAAESDEAELENDGEIDLRDQSPFLAGLAKRFRSRSNPYNPSGKALVGNNWEVHNGHDVTALSPNGTVTEVIDPTTVPVPPVEAGDTVGLAERGPLLPPPQEPEIDSDLPPLVFLDTRGDIIPSIRSTDSECAAPSPIVIEWANNQTAPAARQVEDSIAAGAGTETDAEEAADDIEVVNFDESVLPEPSGETGTIDVDDVGEIKDVEGVDEVVEQAARMFDQYHGPVIAVIASVATDRRAVDEALHETFVTAWESLDSFDPGEPRGPWMFALARRTASEQVAISLQLALEAGGYPEPSHRHEEVPVDKSWEAWEVRLAVDQLAPAEYDVLQMTHRQGLIHPEIAGALDSTVGAVKSHSYSGSRRLVELLDHVIRPEADSNLSEEQASAITWYLAGVADGSDLDGGERTAVKRIRDQLGSPTAWISPDAEARSRFLAVVKESAEPAPALVPPAPDPVDEQASVSVESDKSTPSASPLVRPLGSGSPEPDRVPEATGEHRPIPEPKPDEEARPPYGSIIVGGALIFIALAVVTNLFGLLGGDADLARTYQLQPTVVDPDATAVVHLAPTDNGTRFEFEFGGLNPSRDGHYYSVWLQRTADGAAVPLGSFEWATPGEIIVLSGPSGYDDFDMLVINESVRDGQASLADVVVLSAAID